MKIKSLLATALMLGSVSMANAQGYVPGFGGKHNAVKADFNCGWFISEFVDRNGDSHRGLFGDGMSLMYEHVFNKGYGFGINGIFEKKPGEVYTGMIGPSFVYSGSSDKWIYGYSIGLGYGRFDVDSERFGHEDRNGVGYFVQANIERRLTQWLGIGAGVRVLNITAPKSEDNSYYKTHSHGTSSLRFTIGPRFYF